MFFVYQERRVTTLKNKIIGCVKIQNNFSLHCTSAPLKFRIKWVSSKQHQRRLRNEQCQVQMQMDNTNFVTLNQLVRGCLAPQNLHVNETRWTYFPSPGNIIFISRSLLLSLFDERCRSKIQIITSIQTWSPLESQ